LAHKEPSEDLEHAWEDVKAMFNGGSRKRLSPGQSPVADINDNNIEIKRPRLDVPQYPRQQPYPYPMFAAVGTNPYRLFGNMFPRPSHPAFPFMSMDQTTLTTDRKVNQDMMRGKAVQNPYSFLWGKGLDSLPGDSEKIYANQMNDEVFRERTFDAMRNNVWHSEYLTKEESSSPPTVNSTSSPGLSGDPIYSSAFTPVKRDLELHRKNRKNKPRKGMKIGAIADSILQRNMLASANQPKSDDDNVDIDVSDEEIGNTRDYFRQDIFAKAKKAEFASDFELNNDKAQNVEHIVDFELNNDQAKKVDFANDIESEFAKTKKNTDDLEDKAIGEGLANSDFVPKRDHVGGFFPKNNENFHGESGHLQPPNAEPEIEHDDVSEDTSLGYKEVEDMKVGFLIISSRND
jgi:hypothetical protein